MIYNNTTSGHPTHFLAACDLIRNARGRFNLPSENWPYPTQHRFGDPSDYYYAEVWADGMDWQTNYWLIETVKLANPVIYPLFSFDSHEEQDKFNPYDFENLIRDILWARRNILWFGKTDHGRDLDLFYVRKGDPHPKIIDFHRCYMEHNSQEKVEFWMNTCYIGAELKGWPVMSAGGCGEPLEK